MSSREERHARERDLTEAIDGFHVSEGEKEGGKKKKKDKKGDAEKGSESSEQTKAERKKEMEKALEKARTENGGAPPKLYKKVMELGMQPLYEDLLPKLEAFKSDGEFKKRVDGWNLVELDLPEGQKWYEFREEDFADVTPAEMYRNFLKSDGGRFFQYFMVDKYKDHRSMDCMKYFEAMKCETMPYEEFMKSFDYVLPWICYETDFGSKNPIIIKDLKKLYEKYEGLDLKAASKK